MFLFSTQVAVGAAIRSSGVPREDVFVVTKLWEDGHGEKEATRVVDESLKELVHYYTTCTTSNW